MSQLFFLLCFIASFISIIKSQSTICVWNSIIDWDQLNGVYELQDGTHNGESYWKQSPTPSSTNSCPQQPFYIFAAMSGYSRLWMIHESLLINYVSYGPDCSDHDYNIFPVDPTQCLGWHYHNDALPLTVTTGLCPSLSCDAITLTNTGNSYCDQTFVADYTNNINNVFVYNDIYFVFNQYSFKWYCSQNDNIWSDCDGQISDKIVAQQSDGWTDLDIQSSFTLLMTNGYTATLQCIQTTLNPTAQPTLNPLVSTTSIPTTSPTSELTTSPTSEPTTSPTSEPTTSTTSHLTTRTRISTISVSEITTHEALTNTTLNTTQTINTEQHSSDVPFVLTFMIKPTSIGTTSQISYTDYNSVTLLSLYNSIWMLYVLVLLSVCCVCVCVFFVIYSIKRKDQIFFIVNKSRNIIANMNKKSKSEFRNSENQIRIVIDSDYERSQSLVISWLQNVVELPEYIPLFIQHGFVSMKMVERIVEISYLKEMGIESLQHQNHIMSQIKLLQINELEDAIILNDGEFIVRNDEEQLNVDLTRDHGAIGALH